MAQPIKKKKAKTLMFMAFCLCITAVFAGAIISQASGYNHYRRELNQAMADLETEKQIHYDLLEQMAFYESDAYIERLAREQLGYVRPDEIVFVNIAD
jgi:cell division protein FtsB